MPLPKPLTRNPQPPASGLALDVVIEVPKGSFVKRDIDGSVHFISPLPCPFNYGAVPSHLGLEGDLLDALVLGPRLPLGSRLRVAAWGAITLTDRGMQDDKLVCSHQRPSAEQCQALLRFFDFYARCKALRNALRLRRGRNACEGWRDAGDALARAQPLDAAWAGWRVPF